MDVRRYCSEDANRVCNQVVGDWGYCYSLAYHDCLGAMRIHPILKDYLRECSKKCDSIECVLDCMDEAVEEHKKMIKGGG